MRCGTPPISTVTRSERLPGIGLPAASVSGGGIPGLRSHRTTAATRRPARTVRRVQVTTRTLLARGQQVPRHCIECSAVEDLSGNDYGARSSQCAQSVQRIVVEQDQVGPAIRYDRAVLVGEP